MKKFILALSLTGLAALYLATQGCYYDKEELLYVKSTCDTSAVTLSGTLMPILNANCSNCHNTANGPSQGAGIILDTYAGISAVVSNGKLMASINHTGNFPMPLGGAQLSDCNRSQFQAWINAGAKNN